MHVKLVAFQTCPAEEANTQAQQLEGSNWPHQRLKGTVGGWTGMTSLGSGAR